MTSPRATKFDQKDRSMKRSTLASLITNLVIASSAVAAPPDVKSLFPGGGTVGTTTELTITGNIASPKTAAWVSGTGVTVEFPDGAGKPKAVVAQDAHPGIRWIRFYNSEGATSLHPFVVGTLPEIADVEPNNTLDKAQKVDQSTVINGTLAENGDIDLYAIRIKAGQTLVASIDANSQLGSPLDGLLQLVSPSGEVIEQNDDHRGNDPLIAKKADQDTTWLVRVFGFPATPDSSIRYIGGSNYQYRLTLTTGPFATHSIPQSDGDSTMWKLYGWNIPDELSMAAGLKAENGILGGASLSNTLNITEAPVAKAPILIEPFTPSQELTIGGFAYGAISAPKEKDLVFFKATKGEKLLIDIESRSLGSPLDAVVRVTTPDDKLLIESDDAAGKDVDPNVKITPPADGVYKLQISDVFRHGGHNFAYRIHLKPLVPTMTLASKADHYLLTTDKPLEIPVTITRNDGFDAAVTVSVGGLPKEVECPAVTSIIKTDTAANVKLTLRLTPGLTAWNGPIQVIATHAEGAPPVKAAFQLPGNHSPRIENFWLTIPGAPEAPKQP